jgi:hypothetical protein
MRPRVGEISRSPFIGAVSGIQAQPPDFLFGGGLGVT